MYNIISIPLNTPSIRDFKIKNKNNININIKKNKIFFENQVKKSIKKNQLKKIN